MQNRYIQIDNPAGGDCAFYAFSIALMPILQEELNRPFSESKVLTKLLDLFPVALADEIITRIRNFGFDQPDRTLLNLLNPLLRELLYQTTIKEIQGQYKDFTIAIEEKKVIFHTPKMNHSQIFSDVMGVFSHYYDGTPLDASADNEFYADTNFREKVKELASELKRLNSVQSKALGAQSDLHTGFIPDSTLEAYVRTYLFNDLSTQVTGPAEFSENSPVGNVLKRKTELHTWGTAQDLISLAAHFDVCILTYTRGRLHYDAIYDTRPHIHINQPNPFHWTTLIDLFPLAEKTVISDKEAQYKCFARTIDLTLNEIFAVINSYHSGDGPLAHFGHWGHHHRDLATQIKVQCGSPGANVNSVMQYILDNLPKKFSDKSEFRDRLNYLFYRYCGRHAFDPELRTVLEAKVELDRMVREESRASRSEPRT